MGSPRNRCNFLVSCIAESTVIELRSILVWSTSFPGSTACGSVVFLRSFASSCDGQCVVCVMTSRMHRASRCPLTPGVGGFLRSEMFICKSPLQCDDSCARFGKPTSYAVRPTKEQSGLLRQELPLSIL